MQFAIVLILCVSGLLTLQWSFLFGVILIACGVLLHGKISRVSEDAFFAVMLSIAGIGTVVIVAADLWRRLFN